jgi:D-alanyl-D-alanine carboxypeptidase
MMITCIAVVALIICIVFFTNGTPEDIEPVGNPQITTSDKKAVPVDGGELTEKPQDTQNGETHATAAPLFTNPENLESTQNGEISQGAENSQSAESAETPETTAAATQKPIVTTAASNATFSAEPVQIDGIWYIDGMILVNKTYPLPKDYNPGFNSEVDAAFKKMQQAAWSDGKTNLLNNSNFRSYSTQKAIYEKNVKKDGTEKTETYSARPGYSEHQTGLAIDLNSINDAFADTKECAWILEHCWEYGFIVRYPKGKEHITGYKYEPWHIRYVGLENAKKIYLTGMCLEELYGFTSAYSGAYTG